jgi:hypothetical protein
MEQQWNGSLTTGLDAVAKCMFRCMQYDVGTRDSLDGRDVGFVGSRKGRVPVC